MVVNKVIRKRWGRNLEARRKLCGYKKRSAFAHDLKVSYVTVWRWETGERAPSDNAKLKIARALRIEPGELFSLDKPQRRAS